MKDTQVARRLKDLQKLEELERELLPQPRMKELMQACLRIGMRPKKGMEWILNFSNKDLDQLSAGDWENLIYEVVWFSIWGPPLPGSEAVPSGGDLQDSILDPNRPLPTKEIIGEIQGWTKARLEEFIAHWETVIPLQPKSIIVVKRDRKTGRAEMMLKTDVLYQGFAFSFAQILRMAGAGLNQCPACRIYYSGRSNQTYCTTRCQNRVSLQKFRTKAQPASRTSKKPVTRKKKPKR